MFLLLKSDLFSLSDVTLLSLLAHSFKWAYVALLSALLRKQQHLLAWFLLGHIKVAYSSYQMFSRPFACSRLYNLGYFSFALHRPCFRETDTNCLSAAYTEQL